MKRFLGIIILGVLLSGNAYSDDKEKIGIERCADYNIASNNNISGSYEIKIAFKDNTKIKLIDHNLRKTKVKERSLRREISEYANDNLLEPLEIYGTIFTHGIYGKKKNVKALKNKLRIKLMNIKYKPNELKKDEISLYFNKAVMMLVDVNTEKKLLKDLKMMTYTEEFKKLKFSTKMQEGGYVTNHRQCKLDYKNSPNTFIARWVK